MADSTLNRFLGELDTAGLAAFTPVPPTPASGPDPLYIIRNTDDDSLNYWDGANWQVLPTGGSVTNTGTLTDHAVVLGNGGVDVAVVASLGTSGQVLTSAGAGADPTWQTPSSGSGVVVQVVNTQTGAVATGSTTIPLDDTIPQNTEGNEYMTLAITPTDAANVLQVEVIAMATTSAANWVAVALFRDAGADALAAVTGYVTTTTAGMTQALRHSVVAGSTSATTFKVRIGRQIASGTITFNGQGGARLLGGVMASSITITEIVP